MLRSSQILVACEGCLFFCFFFQLCQLRRLDRWTIVDWRSIYIFFWLSYSIVFHYIYVSIWVSELYNSFFFPAPCSSIAASPGPWSQGCRALGALRRLGAVGFGIEDWIPVSLETSGIHVWWRWVNIPKKWWIILLFVFTLNFRGINDNDEWWVLMMNMMRVMSDAHRSLRSTPTQKRDLSHPPERGLFVGPFRSFHLVLVLVRPKIHQSQSFFAWDTSILWLKWWGMPRAHGGRSNVSSKQ